MRLSHLQHLVCPVCKAALTLKDAEYQNDRIETGTLDCDECGSHYPIVRFIPRFVPEQNYANSFGFEWNKHARTQYDTTSGSNVSEQRFFQETKWNRDLSGELLLEVGSGSGRFTEHAVATGAEVISLDYSNAVEANYASNGHHDNLLIVQGDLYQMPFRECYFDKLICIGVLQHTPDVTQAFHALPHHLKPGGSLVLDVYARKNFWTHLRKTRYWVRPLVRKISPEALYHACERYINRIWWLARLFDRIPRIGNKMNWFLLIPSYRGRYLLSDAMLKEWAILDLFDILSPTYDQPQPIKTVRQWFADAKLTDVEVQYGFNGIEGRGRKPM